MENIQLFLVLIGLSLILGLVLVVSSFTREGALEEPATTTTTTSDPSNTTNNTTTSAQIQTDSVENEYYIFERITPAEVVSGEQYTITVRVEAKQNLALVAYSEAAHPDLFLVSGNLQNVRTGMRAGDVLEDQYIVEVVSGATSITLTGAARTPVPDGEEGRLELDSEIRVLQ